MVWSGYNFLLLSFARVLRNYFQKIKKMKSTQKYNAYVVGKNQILMGVKVKLKNHKAKNLTETKRIASEENSRRSIGEITALEWKKDSLDSKFLAAFNNGAERIVKTYDMDEGRFSKNIYNSQIGDGKIVGITDTSNAVITAVQSGHIQLLRTDGDNESLCTAGPNLKKMKAVENILATGGYENPLKIFDIETRKEIFKAKNLPNDKLQLRVPIDVADLRFLSDYKQTVTVNRYGNIFLYDRNTPQKRPVVKVNIKNKDGNNEPLSALAVNSDDRQIIFGSGKGLVQAVDLRSTAKVLSTFKGAKGSIMGIEICQKEPLVVSVGMDRYLLVHNIRNKKLVKQIYLTSNLLHLLVHSDFGLKDEEEDDLAYFTSDV